MDNADFNRRRFLQTLALAATSATIGGLVPGCGGGGGGETTSAAPVRTLSGYGTIDPHAHPDQFHFGALPKTDLSSTTSKIVSTRFRASSYSAIGDQTGDSYTKAMNQLAYPLGLIAGGTLSLVETTADIPDETVSGYKPGALLSIEGGDALMGSLDNLQNFYNAGVRIITLVHYMNNALGDIMRPRDGQDPGPYSGGLTAFGGQVIERMEDLGMVVDVAHASTDTLTDICDVVSKPFIDSHTSPSRTETITSPTRLRTWAEMEMMVEKGGVICLWPLAFDHPTLPRRTFAHWAAEIAAMKSEFGIEYVALGTDGSGSLPAMIDGYSSISDLPSLADAMRDAGLTENDLKAFFGGNLLRVLGAAIG